MGQPAWRKILRLRLVEPEGDAEQVEDFLLKRGGRCEHVKDGDLFVFRLDAVFDNRGQIAEQRLKAVHLQALVSFSGGRFASGGVGAQGRGNGGNGGGLGLGRVCVV